MGKFNNDLGGGVTAAAPSKSGVAAHDCNCRCYLEYNLMIVEEFAKATGKNVANDGNGGIIKAEALSTRFVNSSDGLYKASKILNRLMDLRT